MRSKWLGVTVAGIVVSAAGTGMMMPPASQGLGALHHISVVASTVAANGDQNPYGLTLDTFKGTAANPNPYYGDLLVSNFSNSAGTSGAGSTILAINPKTGSVMPFASSAAGPVAMAVSPKGPVWVANFGRQGTDGNVEVLTPAGGQFPNGGSIITSSANLAGPWGQVFVPNASAPAFLVTNALNGTLYAMHGFSPPAFNTDTQFTEIGSGLTHRGTAAATVAGPEGMVFDPATGMVYVTDAADNSIRAFYWHGLGTPNQGQGHLVYQGGALKSPAGITLNPLNGDLLVVNQGNNHLVQLKLLPNGQAQVTGQRVLDSTPVNPRTGAGSALFGVLAVKTANGHLHIYFTDDNTNTVDVLK